MDKCIVCGTPSRLRSDSGTFFVQCPRCGPFQLTDVVWLLFEQAPLGTRAVANLSGFLRENPQFSITSDNFERLTKLATPSVSDKAGKLLVFLSRRFPSPGNVFEINRVAFPDPYTYFKNHDGGPERARELAELHLEVMAVTWAANGDEVNFLVSDYLTRAKNWLQTRTSFDFAISADGWAFLDTAKPNTASPSAFVAMSFSPELMVLFMEGIEPAVKAAGYAALRVDRHEHVNRIDDEIIAQLRRSRFCIADLTGQKAGVYYEAGYAQGFSIPVIWSCSETELKDVHFDTRQFNILLWKPGELADFQRRLRNRIEAVIGLGPREQVGE